MNIFITGGTLGIGKELAKYYLRAGHRVGICGRNQKSFQVNFPGSDPRPLFYEVDVTNVADLRAAIQNFSSDHSLDIVVANAGIVTTNVDHITDFKKNRQVLEINLFGVYNTFEVATEIMIRQKSGTMAAISSVAGMVAAPGSPGYSASKSAVNMFCETLGFDLRHFGVHVMSVCPGFVSTRMSDGVDHGTPFLMSAEKAAVRIAKAIESKKIFYAFPRRLAAAVFFLNWLPKSWFRWIFSLEAFNYEEGDKSLPGRP